MLNFDLSYISWRAHHSTGFLQTSASDPSGLIYGVLSQIFFLAMRFKTNKTLVFSCDSRHSLRKEFFPEYKGNRGDRTEEETKVYDEVTGQITDLKERVLPTIGFRNVFEAKGYEGDDIIAKIVMESDERVIVITADNDLYQLLDHCDIYDPNKKELITKSMFTKKFGIRPKQWIKVKTIAGCRTDGVPSCCEGIANGKAIQYLTGKLNPKTATYKKITSNKNVWERNRRLVTIPFDNNMPEINIRRDRLDAKGFKEVCLEYEIKDKGFINSFERLL